MDKKVEIIVFSHRQGAIEKIYCDDYKIQIGNGVNFVITVNDNVIFSIIPWNRIKQINHRMSE